MNTLKNVENVIIINKSRFITNIFSVDSINEIDNYLNEIKNKYKDATHHCYAYILDNTKRFNDDNEPVGTAGYPILDCLEKNNLNHVLCIVTRYFGGIKLGASNLLRAYSNSCKEAINKSEILELIDGVNVKLKFSYKEIDELNRILNGYEIIDKKFDDSVSCVVNIDNDLVNRIKDICEVEVIKKIIIKK